MNGPISELDERARRAVIALPVPCLTLEEIYRIRADGRARMKARNLNFDDNQFAREVAELAADRRALRLRAALDTLTEELAAALSTMEITRLLDIACRAAA